MSDLVSSSDPAVEVRDVVKNYRRVSAGFRLRTLKSALLSRTLTGDLAEGEIVRALRGVRFDVARGEAFGVVGGNGSGKSTLLKLLSGLLQPTAGTCLVRGRVAALIELGAGFHPEISGRENIFINGSMLGLKRREIEERFDEIVAFSGLEDFIEEPVKSYSSGMYVRLGFAVAIHTHPDVLLVDEVLSVGDEAFGRQCLRKIQEELARGCTVLVVSHSLDLIEELCDRALWLDQGQILQIGTPRRVIDAYRAFVAEAEAQQHQSAALGARATTDAAPQEGGAETADSPVPAADSETVPSEEPERWGSGEARITRARILVEQGARREERYQFETGATVVFELDVECDEELEDFVFGIGIKTPRGVDCWGTNTDLRGFEPASLTGSSTVSIRCPALPLAPGEYTIDLAVHARDGTAYDYRRGAMSCTVTSQERGVGVFIPEQQWRFEGGVRWRSQPPSSPTDNPRQLAPEGRVAVSDPTSGEESHD